MEENPIYHLNMMYIIEPILISLTDDNYKPLLEIIKQGIKNYDLIDYQIIERYIFLAEQNQGHVLSLGTLQKEFTKMHFNYVPIESEDELDDYIRIYITKKKQKYIAEKMKNISSQIKSQGLTSQLLEEIYRCTEDGRLDDTYVSILEQFEQLYNKEAEMKGISFLCSELDKLTGGIAPGTICTVLGASGSMKTTYTSNICYNALKDGKNVLYLTLEETPMQMAEKWLSRASIDINKRLLKSDIIQNKLEEQDKKTLLETVLPYFKGLPGHVYFVGEQDLANYDLTTLESKFKAVERLAIRETGHGIDILAVDHIQLLKFAAKGMDEYQTINMYVSFFRQQALSWLHKKKQISVILLSQVNREGIAYAQKHQGTYLMQHVAEASELERSSAYIVSVYIDASIQITKLLTIGAVKLRGSQLPLSTINIFADGEVYQVGDTQIPEQTEYSLTDIFGDNDTPTTTPEVNANLADFFGGIDL